MNSPAPVHLGLERLIRIGQLLMQAVHVLRTAFAIEQRPPVQRQPSMGEPVLRT